ncbi:MAG: hypothetical protein ACOYXO_15215 [Chloroflexota bacterium]
MFQKYLLHEKLPVRFGSLLGIVLIAFFAAWFVGYYFLPEGALRGRNVAQALSGSSLAGGSVWLEWLRILAINLGAMFLLVIAPNLIRTPRNLPLGYSTVAILAVVFGMMIGTNSFTLSLGSKQPPSFMVLGSSGLYEIIAYVLSAAATTSLSSYRLIGQWPLQTIERIAHDQRNPVNRERNIGVLLAVIILVVACGWEAYRISLAVSS